MSNLTSINFLLNHNDPEDLVNSYQSTSKPINLTDEYIEFDIEYESQETNPNDYLKVYTHLTLNTYKSWVKEMLPNISGAKCIKASK